MVFPGPSASLGIFTSLNFGSEYRLASWGELGRKRSLLTQLNLGLLGVIELAY